jgi:hypothetical protein
MSVHSSSNYKKISFFIVIIFIFLGIEYYFYVETANGPVIPDSTLGGINTWLTKTDDEKGITFKYPSELPTTYITSVDWPPMINIYESPFICNEAGNEGERAGITQRKNISGVEYCITRVSGGAAGSVYTQYAYATEKNNRLVIFTFSLRFPQCLNYDGFQREDCEEERSSFNIDKLLDTISRSLTFE